MPRRYFVSIKGGKATMSYLHLSRRSFVSQTWALTLASLKSRYRNTVSGFLWVLLSPLLQYGAQAYAFYFILKLPVDNYPVFLLLGLIPWIFIISSVEMSTGSFTNQGRLLKSFPIHPWVPLMAQIADNLINFAVVFLFLMIPVTILTSFQAISLLVLPLALLPIFVGTFSLSLLLSTLNVFFRDTKFIVSFSTSILFFLTPVFYPESIIPEDFRWVPAVNPIYYMIRPFRGLETAFEGSQFWIHLGEAYVVAGGLMLWAIWYWGRKKNELYFNI